MTEVNTSVSQPPFPIAIRPEHIVATETNLIIEPKCDDHSPEDYIIKDRDGSTVFAVAGKKHGKRSGREFRDGSGLPLFEMYRVIGISRPLRVRLPGTVGKKDNLVEFSMSVHYGKFDMIVQNAAAETAKHEGDKQATVHVRQASKESIYIWELLVGDVKVADIRESKERNGSLGCAPQTNTWYPKPPKRRVLDIKVAEGFDSSLVALAAVVQLYLLYSAD
ncbi:uncharacterized protein EURHEDRAFT_374292 [Aspergillus ruber CBS 135680]|uniref:Tubby C-terminal-like domain-containing protein n=1 Tax=Aspergillus ruber (strain CBS 135680) TaxID=1388766 RepID=A0A017SQH3_ASPRC|nr:uncharacterized protein EURHEDRAFT_374292 [Aspergillus ruber CBS 135680]EYE99233.1 hypothetical protein EURHEDRAFT_374292 [Aspergillus ruber CBS 135680]